MDVNHPFNFINLLSASHPQADFLTYHDPKHEKIPFFKKIVENLFQSAIQELAGQAHHCKSHTHKRKTEAQHKQNKIQTKQGKKVSVLRNGPRKMRRWESKPEFCPDVASQVQRRWWGGIGSRHRHTLALGSAATSILGFHLGDYKNIYTCTLEAF